MAAFRQTVEPHHRLTYQDGIQDVAQQKKNPLRAAVTTVDCDGEARSVADLLGKKNYIRGEDFSRRNPENRANRSRRWLIRPTVIEDGDYIDTTDKWDQSQDDTSHLVTSSVTTVERGVFDTILGIRPKAGGYETFGSGIFGTAAEGKRPGSGIALPSAQFEAAASTGLTLDKLRAVKKKLRQAEFGMEDDDQFYAAITPEQEDDLIGIAAASGVSLNAFNIEQLKSGKPTPLMGIEWIVTNRLPVDSTGNRLIPVWAKKNVVLGFWQDVQGDMWNDTHAKNLPYYYTSVYADCVRIEDAGVRVIRCVEA